MAEVNMGKAREVFATICRMLDNKGWKYEKLEDNLVIKTGVSGEDLPIDIVMKVNPNNQLVSLFSFLPFKTDESKRVDMAMAVVVANYGFADGSFDYDISDGTILFRLTSSYIESTLSEDLFEYMLLVSVTTVDKYNDKFFMISKGMLTIQQFIESENRSD